MKKVFSIVFVLLFLSSINIAKADQKSNLEPIGPTKCQLFAYYAATYVNMNGGDYYQAYFAAYGHCLSGEVQ